MSEIRWDLTGTDKRCEKYGPGHWVHWIHHKKSILEPGIAIQVQVIADDGGLFTLQGPDLLLQGWNHRPALVQTALRRSRGSAVWIPRWRLLVVSTGDRVNGASNVFHLGPLGARTACKGAVDVASWRSQPEASDESPGKEEQMTDDEQIERNKLAAERGWLADPPPPPRAYIPGEENKWFLMMGARDALERKRKRERRGDVR